VFSKLPEEAIHQTSIRSRRVDVEEAIAEAICRPLSTTPSMSSSLPSVSLLMDHSANNSINIDAPLSPASISHALCKIGFDCIDYLTATQDDFGPEPPRVSPNTNSTSNYPVYTSPLLEDLNDSDWKTGLAAAVCGKRTAALERRRALSRSTSQVDIMDTMSTIANNDPWFEAFDRLARWDEVAYR
ncbi:hypothetical protein BGX27_004906, partial [Mortierella sp. AM989]